MFRKKHDNPDGDDMLVAIRRDGNVIIDREIRREFGMVLSDRYNMAIRNDELVSFERLAKRAEKLGLWTRIMLTLRRGFPAAKWNASSESEAKWNASSESEI